jgi:membrane-bound lytic murein transglycosylase D
VLPAGAVLAGAFDPVALKSVPSQPLMPLRRPIREPMRAFQIPAIAASLLLLAPVARAAEAAPAVAKANLKAKDAPAESDDPPESPEPGDGDSGGSDEGGDSGDSGDSGGEYADAAGIQEDLDEGKKELEELLKAENQAIEPNEGLPKDTEKLGVGNPLRARMLDTERRGGEFQEAPAPLPEGDAGELLAELRGIDLAALKAEYDIPVEINDDVIQYVRFFQGTGRKWYARWLERSKRWIPYMRPILAEEGVPLDLVYLAMIESGFSPYAYSWANASGFWQFISATGRRYGLRDDFWVDERRDPERSTRAAARYLKALHQEFGDWYVAWASYNAGEGKLRKAIRLYDTRDFWEISHGGNFLRKETKHYVPKLIAAAIIAKHPERFGFEDPEGESPYRFDEVEIDDATELQTIAEAAGVSVEEIQQLNPSLRRWVTPPARGDKGYKIKIPHEKKETFLAELAKRTPEEPLTFRHHRVAHGETIKVIAKKFSQAGESILRVNGIANAKALRPGTDLIVPVAPSIAERIADSGLTWTVSRSARRQAKVHVRGARMARAGERPTKVTHAAKASAPTGKTYKVRSGDTLSSIARRFGVPVGNLKKWNGIGNQKVSAGRSLYLSPPARKADNGGSKRGRG